MPELLRPPERDRLIACLQDRLWQEGDAADGMSPEPRRPEGAADSRLADAAAHGVALLALPGPRAAWAAFSARLTDKLLAMGGGPSIRAGTVPREFTLHSTDPQDFRILAGPYEFTGDLSRGLVRQALRNGGRAVLHTGHLVEFRSGGANHCLDVEDSTSHFGIERQPDGGIALFHESLFSAPVGLMRRKRFVARLRYTYTIRPDDPRLHLQVLLKAAPKVALRDLRLTTALDELSAGAGLPPFSRITVGAGGHFTKVQPVPQSGEGEDPATVHTGAAESLSLMEEASPARALGLHLGLLSGTALRSVKLVSKAPEAGAPPRPHWLLARYDVASLAAGASTTVEEERLLIAGLEPGEDADGIALLRDATPVRGLDLGPLASTGAALDAIASQIVFGTGGEAPLPEARRAELRGWYDRHLATCSPGRAKEPACHSAGDLAFVVLSLDTMLRAPRPEGGPDHAALLDAGLDMLVSMQRPDGVIAAPGQDAALESHLAALLALTRLLLRGKEPRLLARTLRRGLAALELPEAPEGATAPALRGLPPSTQTVVAALAMRVLGLMLHAADALALEAAEQERLQALHDASFRLLRARLRAVDQMLEVRSDGEREEGDAVTQAVATLALLAPDEAVLALPLASRQIQERSGVLAPDAA